MVVCSQHGAERSEFSRFPAAKTTTASLQRIDWESHPQARSYRSRLRELIGAKADFAGHYKILEVGAGTMASQIFVVDVENGKVYLAPFIASLGVKYTLNSRLLLENDPDAVQEYKGEPNRTRHDWLRVKKWVWEDQQRIFNLHPQTKIIGSKISLDVFQLPTQEGKSFITKICCKA